MKRALLIFVPLLLAYGVTLGWVVDRWNAPTQYYQHGWLLPFVAAFVIWSRRAQWGRTLAVTDHRAWWLLGPGLLLHLAGALLMIDSLSASSLILVVPGAALLVFGRERLRGLWPALWLVLFAVPPPMYVEGRISFVLKEYAVDGGAALANVFGAGVTRAGSSLGLDGTTDSLYVADACGGLRSLLAMITVGYCVAFLLGGPSWRRRLLVMAVTVPVAVGANVVRIAMLCVMARWFGLEFANGTGHTLANIGEWAADLLLLFGVDALASRWFARGDQDEEALPAVVPTAKHTSLRWPAIVLTVLVVPLLGLSLYRPAASGEDRAERLPDVFADYGLLPRTAAQEADFQQRLPQWVELLGTDDFVYRLYRNDAGHWISLVALFHDANWKSVHPPQICIEGSGMAIEIDDLLPAPWLDGGSTTNRILARREQDGVQFLTLSVYGTSDWSSGSYREYVAHHWPLALLRQSESGFLIRAETPVQPGEDLATAKARCSTFLEAVIPSARELLR